MSEGIIIAIIANVVSLVGLILTYISQMKKLRSEQKARDEQRQEHQKEQFAAFKQTTQDSVVDLEKSVAANLAEGRREYMAEIADVKKSLIDTKDNLADLKASYQTASATIELRLANLTEKFGDMQTEVREHNNFAKRMPVMEEQIRNIEKQIDDGK